ncbi:MAG TPA: hypothetical protein VFV92_04915 [Candidatus Bathyarchaeia archaeon]|nr:hypothetical protein [Candidatus Bathyarchaeia archaeon]
MGQSIVTDSFIPYGPNWIRVSAPSAMEYFCKSCGKRKDVDQGWLMALEGSRQGGRVMKYTVTLLRKWDEQRAREGNAVHFCCTACQDRYLSQNYGDETWVA